MPCPKSKSPSIRNEPIRDYALPHRPSFRLCSHFPTRQHLNLRRLSSRSSSSSSSALTVSPLQDASSRSNQFTSAPLPAPVLSCHSSTPSIFIRYAPSQNRSPWNRPKTASPQLPPCSLTDRFAYAHVVDLSFFSYRLCFATPTRPCGWFLHSRRRIARRSAQSNFVFTRLHLAICPSACS